MKRIKLILLVASILCLSGFVSCSNDDDARWSTFNGVSVTVRGDEISGYKLYTDFGAILIPSSTSLSQVAWLKEVWRATISFSLADNETDATVLESGKTYHVVLNTLSGMNQEIPTYIVCVDTLSIDYQTNGNDSIALKNKSIRSIDKTAEYFYVKNGYMNVVPTFDYDPYQLVSFLLYYDSEKDIDVANNKLVLNLFFNNNTQNSYNSTSSLINFRMPEDIYYSFQDEGLSDTDSIEVYLNAKTDNGSDQVQCKMALKDFMLP